jgi:hypothetical protein
MLRAVLRALPPVLAPLVVLACVVLVGRWARAHLGQQEDWSIAFAAIDCAAPPGMSSGGFLDEVQYLSALPDRLSLLDPSFSRHLAYAFARHPWVEEAHVARVARSRKVHVELTFRKPVLLVGARGAPEGDASQSRAVDRDGVLLPRSAITTALPLLNGTALPPPGPTGAAWGDRRVVDAAALAAFLQPRGSAIQLGEVDVEMTDSGLVLQHQGRRVVWGKPPGREGNTEAAAEVKWQRFVAFLADRQLADECLYDLRPLQAPASRGMFALARP